MSNALPVPKWHKEVEINSKIMLVVIDMQKLFLTDKKSPWMDKKLLSIIPNIEKLIKTLGEQNVIFTRFAPPKNWQDEHGSWQTYYRINQKITTSILGTEALDIVDNFIQYIPNASVASRKKSASIFLAGNFHSKIKKQSTEILIFTGIETDYCVL